MKFLIKQTCGLVYRSEFSSDLDSEKFKYLTANLF